MTADVRLPLGTTRQLVTEMIETELHIMLTTTTAVPQTCTVGLRHREDALLLAWEATETENTGPAVRRERWVIHTVMHLEARVRCVSRRRFSTS